MGRRGHGRDGVHRGRVEHERPCLRVPAVPGRLRRGGGRVRGGGRRGVLDARLESFNKRLAPFVSPQDGSMLWAHAMGFSRRTKKEHRACLFKRSRLSRAWYLMKRFIPY